jgi:hypothetical protein
MPRPGGEWSSHHLAALIAFAIFCLSDELLPRVAAFVPAGCTASAGTLVSCADYGGGSTLDLSGSGLVAVDLGAFSALPQLTYLCVMCKLWGPLPCACVSVRVRALAPRPGAATKTDAAHRSLASNELTALASGTFSANTRLKNLCVHAPVCVRNCARAERALVPRAAC